MGWGKDARTMNAGAVAQVIMCTYVPVQNNVYLCTCVSAETCSVGPVSRRKDLPDEGSAHDGL